MTRLFGCMCNQPARFVEALQPVRDVLRAPGPVSRWGLGYVQGGEVLLSRNPRPSAEGVDFFPALERLRSDYVVGQATGDDGLTGTPNTQPFRFRRWMYADSGSIDSFAEVKESLIEHIPDFLRRNIKGKTASEHVFHVFLAFLHDAGNLDDPNLPTEATRRALRDALGLVMNILTRSGGTYSAGNIVLCNSRSMVAARLGEPLYLRRLFVPDAKQGRDETFRGVLATSSTQHPGEGFEEIPERSVLSISRDLRTDIAELDA
jgi:predicted glutamine amidotransferase